MKYQCVCGFQTNDWSDWLYHMMAPKTPWLAIRSHRRITGTFVSGV